MEVTFEDDSEDLSLAAQGIANDGAGGSNAQAGQQIRCSLERSRLGSNSSIELASAASDRQHPNLRTRLMALPLPIGIAQPAPVDHSFAATRVVQ